MKRLSRLILDILFIRLASRLFRLYDHSVRYRLSRAAGISTQSRVKNVGKDLRVHGFCHIVQPHNLEIGSYVRIGAGGHINCLGGVEIGDNVQISRNVVIYSANHDYQGDAIPYDDSYRLGKVKIGDSVWIGMGVKILPGVTIGEGAIIGMGTVVSKDVPPMAILVGGESRIVGIRDHAHYSEMVERRSFFGSRYQDL